MGMRREGKYYIESFLNIFISNRSQRGGELVLINFINFNFNNYIYISEANLSL